jgi:microcystin-dependent protein
MSGLQVHVPHFAEYATKTAREADITLDSTHVGKIALQMDDGSYWRLVAGGDPPQWARVGGGILLAGLISPYSGTFGGADNKFPLNAATGEVDLRYALCDGGTYTAPDGRTVTTPDLRGRFVVAASDDIAADEMGGSEDIVASVDATTLSQAQMPSHSHSYGKAAGADGSGAYGRQASSSSSVATGSAGSNGSHAHGLTVAAGANMPPYYALAYIIAL